MFSLLRKNNFFVIAITLAALSLSSYRPLSSGIDEKKKQLMSQYRKCGIAHSKLNKVIDSVTYACQEDYVTEQTLSTIILNGAQILSQGFAPELIDCIHCQLTEKTELFLNKLNGISSVATRDYKTTMFVLNTISWVCENYVQKKSSRNRTRNGFSRKQSNNVIREEIDSAYGVIADDEEYADQIYAQIEEEADREHSEWLDDQLNHFLELDENQDRMDNDCSDCKRHIGFRLEEYAEKMYQEELEQNKVLLREHFEQSKVRLNEYSVNRFNQQLQQELKKWLKLKKFAQAWQKEYECDLFRHDSQEEDTHFDETSDEDHAIYIGQEVDGEITGPDYFSSSDSKDFSDSDDRGSDYDYRDEFSDESDDSGNFQTLSYWKYSIGDDESLEKDYEQQKNIGANKWSRKQQKDRY